MRCIRIIKRIGTVSLCIMLTASMMTGCSKKAASYAAEYEQENYNKSLYQGELFASDLCVSAGDVAMDGYTADSSFHAEGLFDIKDSQILYSDKAFDRLYPASTTKILTAYLALKYGNLDDVVTVSANAVDFEADAQVCGLQAGDQLTLYDLLAGLLLYSGNDNAAAIAEHISGSEEAFVNQMNQEAWNMGATQTHFVNPHGLHDPDHYTTAYDLYLMFNACVKDQRFIDIISMDAYNASITGADGTVRTQQWAPTNYYSAGETPQPAGTDVLGGKTGTTDEAGSCVVLYELDSEGKPYISVVMGAEDKDSLYNETTRLLETGLGSD